jgi:hypothetical protein
MRNPGSLDVKQLDGVLYHTVAHHISAQVLHRKEGWLTFQISIVISSTTCRFVNASLIDFPASSNCSLLSSSVGGSHETRKQGLV